MGDFIVRSFIRNGWEELGVGQEDLVLTSLLKINPGRNKEELKQAIDILEYRLSQESSLKERNKIFLEFLRNGINTIRLVDWERPLNNNFHFSVYNLRRLEVELIGFLNGFPVIFLKYSPIISSENWFLSQVSLWGGLLPELMSKMAIVVMTDFNKVRLGSLVTEWFSFSKWLSFSSDNTHTDFEKVISLLADREEFLRVIESFSLGDIKGVMEEKVFYGGNLLERSIY